MVTNVGLRTFTRVGFAGRGLLYMIIGWLIFRTGRSEDLEGALDALEEDLDFDWLEELGQDRAHAVAAADVGAEALQVLQERVGYGLAAKVPDHRA